MGIVRFRADPAGGPGAPRNERLPMEMGRWAEGRRRQPEPRCQAKRPPFPKDAAEQEMLRYGTAAVMLIG
jgi:hypothetical protein